MEDHRDRSARAGRRDEAALESPFRAGKDDFWHVGNLLAGVARWHGARASRRYIGGRCARAIIA